MDLHEEYHKETVRMPAVLLGVASAAIGFAFHKTSDRTLSFSLLPLLLPPCAGEAHSRSAFCSRAPTLSANIGLNLAEQAGQAAWQQQAKSMFDRHNRTAGRRYAAQQWLLLVGAGFYLAGHVWHLASA